MVDPQTATDLWEARVEVCSRVADELAILAELMELVGIGSWARHFARDSELMQMKALSLDEDAFE